MTDLLLATVSLAGLLAYSTVGVAIHTRRMRRPGTLWDLTIWKRIGLALAAMGTAGGVLVLLLITTHGNDGISDASALWALCGGITAILGATGALIEPQVDAIYGWFSALWLLSIPFTILVRCVAFAVYLLILVPLRLLALVPLRLGRALAGQTGPARTFTSSVLDGRIADLERELGIGGTQ